MTSIPRTDDFNRWITIGPPVSVCSSRRLVVDLVHFLNCGLVSPGPGRPGLAPIRPPVGAFDSCRRGLRCAAAGRSSLDAARACVARRIPRPLRPRDAPCLGSFPTPQSRPRLPAPAHAGDRPPQPPAHGATDAAETNRQPRHPPARKRGLLDVPPALVLVDAAAAGAHGRRDGRAVGLGRNVGGAGGGLGVGMGPGRAAISSSAGSVGPE